MIQAMQGFAVEQPPRQSPAAQTPEAGLYAQISQKLNAQSGPGLKEKAAGKTQETVDEHTWQTRKEEDKRQDSKCCNGLWVLNTGLVGILEGFGLLDQIDNQDLVGGDDPLSGLGWTAHALVTSQVENGEPDSKGAVFDHRAWMPEADRFETRPKNLQTKGETNSDPRLCSFENVNNENNTQADQAREQVGRRTKLAQLLNQAIDGETEKRGQHVEDDRPKVSGQPLTDASAFLGQTHASDCQGTEPQLQGELAIEPWLDLHHQVKDHLSELVKSLETKETPTGQTCELSLKPEHLGKLRIRLNLDPSGIRAFILAEDVVVDQVIRKQVPQLRSLLEDRGLNVLSMDVGRDPYFSDQQASQPQNRRPSQAHTARRGLAKAAIEGEGLWAENRDTGFGRLSKPGRYVYSSVEFKA